MVNSDFDPKIFATTQRITKQVFGDPSKKEGPKVHSDIPEWDEELLKVTRIDADWNQYFTYPGRINWDSVPKINIKGARLINAKRAMKNLSKRVEVLKSFGFFFFGPSDLEAFRYATAAEQGRYCVRQPDLTWGLFQQRTYARFNGRFTGEPKRGLKGKTLISIWKRFGIDVLATWPNQVDYDPSVGAPMNAYGSAIRDKYSNWSPGTWEWHKNEYLIPDKTYYSFIFPVVNIRFLFHIIERYKLVFIRPHPIYKRAR